MFQKIFISLFVSFLFFSCNTTNKEEGIKSNQLTEGSWLFSMDLGGRDLPFEAEISKNDTTYKMVIINGEERIEIDELSLKGDSLIIAVPVFESAFFLKVSGPDNLKGVWVNYYKGPDYKIKVTAYQTEEKRFGNKISTSSSKAKLASRYKVVFSPGDKSEYPSIGLFEQTQNRISGTFATETGDYRYLEGVVSGDSLFLSTFDGSHAFLFEAQLSDESLSGVFYSGTHFSEPWTASADNEFSLRDPDSLTFSSDSTSIDFQAEDENGNIISLSDDSFIGKIKLIQIMGTWCPNCLDESVYFKSLKEKYAKQDFEIIALAFERTKGKERALRNIKRLSEQNELNYPVLLGGFNREQHPMDIFPMLNHIMSYPTTLYLDRQNKIRKIHTGFYGPGTGSFYDEYKAETEDFIDSLLSED